MDKKNIRILVVDDSPPNLEVALALLGKLGFENVKEVLSGRDALVELSGNRYDIVLMDCQMPEVDGYSIASEIREKEKRGEYSGKEPHYIIAMTAHALAGDRDRCLEAGMNDYISKPVRLKILDETLKKWERSSKEVNAPQALIANTVSDQAPESEALPKGLVDEDRLNEISFGDPSRRMRILTTYFRDSEPLILELEHELQCQDYEKVKRLTHKWGGTSVSIGMNGVGAPLREMEWKLSTGGRDGMGDLFECARRNFKESKKQLLGSE